ncbi:MAG: alpha-amylase [Gemmatimonadota bacterium]
MSDTNGVMMQYFHWYSRNDGSLWKEVAHNAKQLAALGITSLWLPPAFKGSAGANDVGYGAYDLFDLGEFDQKGSVRTKYGTRDELITACRVAREAGLRIYADAVFNHKMGGDAEEDVEATPYDPENRTVPAGEPTTIRAWTHFSFPGRAGKHSSMEWHWHHFTAVDQDDGTGTKVFLFRDKQFDTNVDDEKGNYDFLMGCDIDTQHPEVRGELEYWGEWFVNTTGVDGFRFDAVKHVEAGFFRDWLAAVSARTNRPLFAVGEYWSYDVETLQQFLTITERTISLFDAPLHHNFHMASVAGPDYDLRLLFESTLVQREPALAVTLVENHDSQPLQALESVVEPWFKPLAYALILLRRDGYPCIFHADYFGAEYTDSGNDGDTYDIQLAAHQFLVDRFLAARQHHAWGEQQDYFDDPHCIGWTRAGDAAHPGGVAVLMSNREAGEKVMRIGMPNARYRDITGHVDGTIETDAEGCAAFTCTAGQVSVWIPAAAATHAATAERRRRVRT